MPRGISQHQHTNHHQNPMPYQRKRLHPLLAYYAEQNADRYYIQVTNVFNTSIASNFITSPKYIPENGSYCIAIKDRKRHENDDPDSDYSPHPSARVDPNERDMHYVVDSVTVEYVGDISHRTNYRIALERMIDELYRTMGRNRPATTELEERAKDIRRGRDRERKQKQRDKKKREQNMREGWKYGNKPE